MKYTLKCFSSSVRAKSNVRPCRNGVGIVGVLLLVALVLLTGCPDDGGNGGPPPPTPHVVTGAGFSCALLTGGSVKCWGLGSFGVLGQGNTNNIGDGVAGNLTVAAAPPINLGDGRMATQISTGGGGVHACALLDNNSVKCWGNSLSGQLGQGNTNNIGDGAAGNLTVADAPPINLGDGRTASQIIAGGEHTCAILDNNSVKCWGSGFSGQLGQGNTNNIGDGAAGNLTVADAPPINLGDGRTATQISAGGLHTCALLDNNTVKCWGNGLNGQLGQGNTNGIGDGRTDRLTVADAPPINLGDGRTATQIIAGGEHTCALLDNNSVKCWGRGANGRLGSEDTTDALSPPATAVNLGDGRTATQISAGGSHSCAVLDNGGVKCWGNGEHGRLGVGSVFNVGDGGETTDAVTMVTTTHLTVAAADTVNLGTGRAAMQISAGNVYTCVLLDGNGVKCWGGNGGGQLGQGSAEDIGDMPGELGDNLPQIVFFNPGE